MRYFKYGVATPVSHRWRVVPFDSKVQLQRVNAVLYLPAHIYCIPPVATWHFQPGIALLCAIRLRCHTGLHPQKKVVCTWHYANLWHDVVGWRGCTAARRGASATASYPNRVTSPAFSPACALLDTYTLIIPN